MININNVSFSYPDGMVLNDVTMTIQQGDYIGLLGSNGSGKSTLIKLILGLLQPSEGSIDRHYKRIAYVPQQGLEDVFFPVTVNELLKFRLPARKATADDIHAALKRVGLQDEGRKLIKNLSGGQRQRVLIARELLIHPDVLILDEPSTGLDQRSIQSLYKLLNQLHQDEGLTIILVTHHIDEQETKGMRLFEVSNHAVTEVSHV